MVESTVLAVGWNLSPATLNHAPSRSEISERNSALNLMGSILISMVCNQMCVGSQSTVEVSISVKGPLAVWHGIQTRKSLCTTFLFSSSDQGPMQIVLQGSREYSLLPATRQSNRWNSMWPRHKWYLCPRSLPGMCQIVFSSLWYHAAKLWLPWQKSSCCYLCAISRASGS